MGNVTTAQTQRHAIMNGRPKYSTPLQTQLSIDQDKQIPFRLKESFHLVTPKACINVCRELN